MYAKGHIERSKQAVWFFPTIGEYCSVLERSGFQVATAWFYDRPTPLKDDQFGIVDWIIMFGQSFLKDLEGSEQIKIAKEVQDKLAPHLLNTGTWTAVYKRLRVIELKL